MGSEVAIGLSDAREGHSADLLALESVNLFGLHAAARYRVFDALALGVRWGWATEVGARGYESSSGERGRYDRHLVQLALEGRYQPAALGWYAAARGGAAAMTDGVGR